MKISLDSRMIEIIQTAQGYLVRVDGQDCPVEVLRAEDGYLTLRFSAPSSAPQSAYLSASSSVSSSAPHSAPTAVFSAYFSSDGPNRWLTINGQTFRFKKGSGASRRSAAGHAHSAGELLAPMPGQVRAVQAAEGHVVVRGQTLLVLEAMKMEIKIAAPFDGRVKHLKVWPGVTVEKEQLLAEIEPAA